MKSGIKVDLKALEWLVKGFIHATELTALQWLKTKYQENEIIDTENATNVLIDYQGKRVTLLWVFAQLKKRGDISSSFQVIADLLHTHFTNINGKPANTAKDIQKLSTGESHPPKLSNSIDIPKDL
jgi:hypothetical protein